MWALRRQRFLGFSLVLSLQKVLPVPPALGTRLCIAPPWWVIVRCSSLVSCGEGWEGTPLAAPLFLHFTALPQSSRALVRPRSLPVAHFGSPFSRFLLFLTHSPVFANANWLYPRRTPCLSVQWPRKDASHSAFRSSLPTLAPARFRERFSACSWMKKGFLIWPSFIRVHPILVVLPRPNKDRNNSIFIIRVNSISS